MELVNRDEGYVSVLADAFHKFCRARRKLRLTRLSFHSSNHLEKSLQLLMDRVDDLNQDIVKYNTYSRNLSKQQQQKHQSDKRRKKFQENEDR
ncbi:hypothetical protein CCH79_00007457 [Gambusia affinis]|uniref:eIF3h C-terminal domain-containing protein n=1 Tax=Gambusia affinis TaxID=33528 RepID=A0A315WC33_GAMAF|nr:hypothetical protein CCH79_00007457 [Gambusia affinis]